MKVSILSNTGIAIPLLFGLCAFVSSSQALKDYNASSTQDKELDSFQADNNNFGYFTHKQGSYCPLGKEENGESKCGNGFLNSIGFGTIKTVGAIAGSASACRSLSKRAPSALAKRDWADFFVQFSAVFGSIATLFVTFSSSICGALPVLCPFVSILIAACMITSIVLALIASLVYLWNALFPNPAAVNAAKDFIIKLQKIGHKIPQKYLYILDLDPFGNKLETINIAKGNSNLEKRSEEYGVEQVYAIPVDETKFIKKESTNEDASDVSLITNEKGSIFFESQYGYHIAIPLSDTVSKDELTKQVLHSTPNVPHHFEVNEDGVQRVDFLSFTFDFDDKNLPFYKNLADMAPEYPVVDFNNLNQTSFCGSFKTGPYANDIGVQYYINTFGNLTDACRLAVSS